MSDSVPPQSGPSAQASATPPARLRAMGLQAGALLGFALLLAVLLSVGIAYQHGRLSRAAEVYFLADDVNGLAPGITVRLSGLRVGQIESMQLQPDLKVRVQMRVDAEAFGYLRSDARADMVREQLKPVAIELRPGKSDRPVSQDDPRIGFLRRGTLTEIADDLRSRLAPILDDVKQLTGTVREHREDLGAMLSDAREAVHKLSDTAQNLKTLTGDLRGRVGTLGAQSVETLAEANRTVVKLGTLVGQGQASLDIVNTRLPQLLQRTDDTLSGLQAIARDGRAAASAAAAAASAVATATAELPPMMRALPPLVDDSREMVQGLRQSWPVRQLMPAPGPLLLPIDSHDPTVLRAPAPR